MSNAMKLRAVRTVPYHESPTGKAIKAGETYEVDARKAQEHIRAGMAEPEAAPVAAAAKPAK